ncbi:MAG TPA: PQQ-like beta-propeller repeat protein [Gemmatales bacterium]|nr:PQQ-like beta-propeller repeat protein [Gemmatales bacterium]
MAQRLVVVLAALFTLHAVAGAADWPQWLGANRDGVWLEEGILEKFPEGGPKVVWRTPLGGGYSGPAVAGGQVFVMDRRVERDAAKPQNDFDRQTVIKGYERVVCLNEADGQVIWTHEYPCDYRISYQSGPRCTPTVDGDRVYCLGAMGDLHCLSAVDGRVLWSKNFIKDYGQEPAVWGWSAHPLVDGDRLICIVGGEGTTAVAFDKMTGKELWRALSAKDPGYAPPVIFTIDGVRHLLIWTPRELAALVPESGKLLWSVPFESRQGLSIPTPRLIGGNKVFVTAFYNGPLLVEVTGGATPRAEVVWKGTSQSEMRTDKLHAIMCTPYSDGEFIYGVCSYGQLRCLKVADGTRVWETFKATTAGRPVRWANAFLTPQAGRYFLFNEKGELIIARLTAEGYDEIDRAKLIEPTSVTAGRDYVWTHPAFANKRIFVRNDQEIACFSLAK